MALAAVKELQMRAQLAQMQLRWLSMLSRWRVWTDRRHAQSKTWRHTSSERFGNEEDAYGGDHVNTSVDDLLGGSTRAGQNLYYFPATHVLVQHDHQDRNPPQANGASPRFAVEPLLHGFW
mmetsp:Transcript_19974/g.44050  ORF Transcript_19974/g.44050 Transcript_19974/m.44050 type:complete len:121 (+) Transcript_19974:57-419(+)